MEISSWQCDLLMFKALIILIISLSLKTTEENLSLTKIGWLGHSLSMLRSVHWRLKNSLNLLYFSLKSDKRLSSMKRSGITGTFPPLKNVFSIDQ